MKLTQEQKQIIATDVPRGQLLKVTAFAGCAKTTTLREYTVARPDERFLYLAFNTTVAAEARDTFPPNVTAKTTHALAFAKYGFQYKEKLGFLKPYILTENLGISNYPIAKYLIDVLVKYLSSADKDILEKHLILNKETSEQEYKLSKDPATIKYLLGKANELWEAMQDPKNKKIPMLHDGYLKLYQLSEPQLPYDYILLDEAHDTNDVTLDIFMKQKCAKILVGDSHQSIYEFRHSYDAVGITTADINQYLSTSFRFGNSIASMANMLLSTIKGENKPIVGFQPADTIGAINTNNPYTIVARTNGALFDEAASLICSTRCPKFGFVGATEKEGFNPFKPYYFDRIMDVFYLFSRQKSLIKDIYIKRFRDFDQFLEIVEDKDAPDIELKSRATVVRKYKYEIPDLVDRIVKNSYNPKQAGVLFTTAHKAKGLEWEQVKLTNDYVDLVRNKKGEEPRLVTLEDVSSQEINLLYVAATRAKNTLQLNRSLFALREFLENR